MDQNSQNIVLINNSRTAWPTNMLLPFLSSLDNLLQDAYIIFQKGVDNFEIAHKHANFWLGVSLPHSPLHTPPPPPISSLFHS